MLEENENLLKNLKFKCINISWIGKINDYFFEIIDKQDSENELIVSLSLSSNENKSKIFQFFDKLQADSIISNYTFNENEISVIYLENSTESLDSFLNLFVEQLQKIEMKCKCNCCVNSENLNFYTNGQKYLLLCPECSQSLFNKFEKEKNKSTHYFKGFLGSLLGALIGSVVWIIIGALGFIASIAGAAISYGAFKGYSFFHGKLTKKGIVLNVITIIIAFLFAQYMVLFIEFMKEIEGANFSLYLWYTPFLFSDIDFIKGILPDLGFGILFAFLGSSSTIKNNLNQAKYNEDLKLEKLDF